MKAYKIRIEAQMEGLDCFCCDYGSCTPDYFLFVDLVVVAETASKARYMAICLIRDNRDLSDHTCIGDLMRSSSVHRTKRKYNYRKQHVKVIDSDEEEAFSHYRQPDEEYFFGLMDRTTTPASDERD